MKQLLIFLFLFVLALGIDLTKADIKTAVNDTITVTIQGAVEKPGAYEVEMYATLQNVLEEAVAEEDADLSSFNPQQILKDKDIIIIPAMTEESLQKISINTGSLEQLCTLPGIGESTAQKIIDYRNENGLFQTIEEIMKVKGIGEAKYEKLKDRISL